jgi:hypothetical protein
MIPLALVLLQLAGAAPVSGEVKPPATNKWKKVTLSALKKAAFTFNGTFKVPPGTKIEDGRASSGTETFGMVTLTLATGEHVLLMERAANAPTESKRFRALFAQMGQTIKLEREGPTWFVLGMERESKFALQGESWAVRPGLSCGVKETIDHATFERVTAICISLEPVP